MKSLRYLLEEILSGPPTRRVKEIDKIGILAKPLARLLKNVRVDVKAHRSFLQNIPIKSLIFLYLPSFECSHSMTCFVVSLDCQKTLKRKWFSTGGISPTEN